MTTVHMTDPGGSSLTLLQFKGFNFPTFDPVALENLETFEFRDDDVLISAFPKAGTHWLWEIARMLVAGNAELPVLEKDDFMIEFNPSKEYFNSMPSPRILNTHVLYRHLPGLHNRKCKIIYVTRDPRDVAVSFYNHHRKLTSYYHYDGTWDNYFELFINGNVDYGCCLDHMRDWEDVIAAHPELNIIVTSYEDLQENPVKEITRLAEFLGKSYDPSFIETVRAKCSFDSMRDRKGNMDATSYGEAIMYRKGKSGDWRNWFNDDQSKRMDEKFREKMDGSQLNVRYSFTTQSRSE